MFRPIFSLLLLVVFALSCGKGNNNFIEDAEPEFAIEGTGFIQLKMPTDEDKNRTQDALMIRNSGDGEMTIQSIEWIDQPDRLVPLLKRGSGCDNGSCDGALSEDGEPLNEPVCLTTTMTCNGTGFPATPLELGAQLRRDFEFLITQGSRELTCPSPSIELPATILEEEYCGSLRITTNAKTNSADGSIVEGVATVYFLAPEESSGLIGVTPNFMEFINAAPGVAQEQTLSIANTGEQDLEIRQISVSDNRDWFEIVPIDDPVPTTIAPGNNMTWTVRMTPPAGTPEEDLDFTTTLEVDSSAGNAASGIIAVQVSAGAGDAPVFEASADVLRFDAQATQTLTITNSGSATLTVSGLDVGPAAAEVFYTITVDGAPFNGLTIPATESRDVTIAFARPGGNTDTSAGILEINHNDDSQGNLTELVLLGDEGDVPLGQVSPTSLTFYAADQNNETRDFVIRNLGTADLTITNVMWNFSTGDNSEFLVNNANGTIAPGGIQRVTVQFTGADAAPDVGLAIFESNNAGQLDIGLRALDSQAAVPVPVVTPMFQGNAQTGFLAQFSADGSTPADATSSALWVLLARPAASTAWMSDVGNMASFVPDVAGSYTVGLLINSGDREAQTTFDFTAE